MFRSETFVFYSRESGGQGKEREHCRVKPRKERECGE